MVAAYSRYSYVADRSPKSRITAAALAVAVVLLLLLALLRLGAFEPFSREVQRSLSTFQVGSEAPTAATTPQKKAKAKPVEKRKPPPPVTKLPPPVVPMPIPGLLNLTRDEFAATDIGKIHSQPDDSSNGKADASADSAAAYGPGAGPGGKRLFNAEWFREPTRAEMAFYMPGGVTEGWGLIACRTIPRNHVESCQVLGESPGSGIGRGMRQAAWQFLVIPPRINGKAQIGAWVRIRFDIVKGIVK